MRKIRILSVALLFTLLLIGAVAAQQGTPDSAVQVVVGSAWVRPTNAAMTGHSGHSAGGRHSATPMTTAAYMTITNQGDAPISLVEARTLSAQITELHETVVENEIMRMGALDALVIDAGETVALMPGGYHLMLIDLNAPLVSGDAIGIVLLFTSEEDPAGASPFMLTVGALVAETAPTEDSPLQVSGAWVRPQIMMGHGTRPGDTYERHLPGENGGEMSMGDRRLLGIPTAAYMTITNTAATDDALIAVESPVATVEIHEVALDGEVMRMARLDSLPIPAGDYVLLEPGGYHLMILELTQPVVETGALALTLIFESGESLSIAVPAVNFDLSPGHMDMPARR